MKRFFAALILCILGFDSASAAGDCATPVAIEPSLDRPVKALTRIDDYHVILKSCRPKADAEIIDAKAPKDLDAKAQDAKSLDADQPVIAIRSMTVDGEKLLLTVDPKTLTTRLERDGCWACGELDPGLKQSRYMRAVSDFAKARDKKELPAGSNWLVNAGLTHGQGDGAFVTGDLCPTHRPLDRAFLVGLEKERAPVALSITGLWIKWRPDDFLWLRQEKAAGRLNILWVNHSFHHPFQRNVSEGETFILKPGLDPKVEILDVERLLIANGETPSVFFRFPGLVSNDAWMGWLRDDYLIPLGADAWLAIGQKPKPGSIVLVHPNGNEPLGITKFKRLDDAGDIRKPLRPLEQAP